MAPACSSEPSENEGESEADVSAPRGVLLRGGRLVDPATKEIYEGAILVEKGAIKKIARGRSAARLSAGTVIEAAGKFVLPGLTDLHTHLFFGNSSPHGFDDEPSKDSASQEVLGNRYLHAGVTSYLDLFSPSDAGDDPATTLGADLNIFALRDRERSGALVHPHSHVAGPLLLVPGSHSVESFAAGDIIQIKVKDAAGQPLAPAELTAVARAVSERVERLIDERHPDVVKFIYDNHEDMPSDRPEKMPLVIAKAIIGAAKARQVKTVAHVGSWEAVEDLAKEGLSAFTHLPNEAAPPSTLEALRQHDVVAITTMSIYNDYGEMSEASKRNAFVDNLAASLLAPPGLVSAYRDYAGFTETEKGWVTWGKGHNAADDQGKALRSLIDGRVPILAGTDSGNTGALYGFSLARELMQLEKAGMPAWDVLATATSEAQKFLGQKRGALKVGYEADLVVVDANPLERVSNLQQVSAVVLKGKVVDRANLAR